MDKKTIQQINDQYREKLKNEVDMIKSQSLKNKLLFEINSKGSGQGLFGLKNKKQEDVADQV